MRTARRGLLVVAALLPLALAAGTALAEYPDRPIKLVVPYAPGGASDVVGRILAQGLEKQLGQSVAVVNVDGGGGAVAWQQVLSSRPDGYTLSMFVEAMPVMEATGAVQFTQEDFAPAATWGTMDLTIFAKPGGPIQTLADLRAAAQASPGKIGLGMGHGTPAQFYSKAFEDAFGEDLNLVNIGGGAKKKAAVLGGHVETAFEPVPGVAADVRAGQLSIVAMLSDVRNPDFPDVPTAKEQGVDFSAFNTYVLIAPKGTPDDRLAKLDAAVAALAKDPDFIEANRKVSFNVGHRDRHDSVRAMAEAREKMLAIGKSLGF